MSDSAEVSAAELPYVDEHAVTVAAPPQPIFDAIASVLRRTFGPSDNPVIRVLGAQPSRTSGGPLRAGSTFPAFAVDGYDEQSVLALTGRHRFSHYALVFRLAPAGADRTTVTAETRAVFPGWHGTVYRMLVIGTKGHVLATRRLLAMIRDQAQAAGQPSR